MNAEENQKETWKWESWVGRKGRPGHRRSPESRVLACSQLEPPRSACYGELTHKGTSREKNTEMSDERMSEEKKRNNEHKSGAVRERKDE